VRPVFLESNRRAARPTAANIFAAFTGLGYRRARTTEGLEYIPDPITTAQAVILKALGIPSILPPRQSRPRSSAENGASRQPGSVVGTEPLAETKAAAEFVRGLLGRAVG